MDQLKTLPLRSPISQQNDLKANTIDQNDITENEETDRSQDLYSKAGKPAANPS